MLNAHQVAAQLTAHLGSTAIRSAALDSLHPWLAVGAESWLAAATYLKEEPELEFDLLRCLTGLDYPEKQEMHVALDLMSFRHRHQFCLKVILPRAKPTLPSVAGIWKAADWHERETWDLFGIHFQNHPDEVTDLAGLHPRRILLPEDWEGFPLRKDYVFPREYHGLPASVELDWAQKADYPS